MTFFVNFFTKNPRKWFIKKDKILQCNYFPINLLKQEIS